MKVGRWSTTAGNNNATPPDGWPEGQAPSTVNDCARENMAALRTAFADLQYFDQDFTPTYISATSFSVPGNQTSAIHAGRRLKLFTGSTLYGTVSTASFTTVTTINVDVDAGTSLTSSLSSFGISVLSNDSNGIPRGVNLSASAVAAATLSVSGGAVFAGAVSMAGTLSISGTAVAANIAKAWVCFEGSATSGTAMKIRSSFNVSTVSYSSTGSYVLTFATAFADANYAPVISLHERSIKCDSISALASSLEIKITLESSAVSGQLNASKTATVVIYR